MFSDEISTISFRQPFPQYNSSLHRYFSLYWEAFYIFLMQCLPHSFSLLHCLFLPFIISFSFSSLVWVLLSKSWHFPLVPWYLCNVYFLCIKYKSHMTERTESRENRCFAVHFFISFNKVWTSRIICLRFFWDNIQKRKARSHLSSRWELNYRKHTFGDWFEFSWSSLFSDGSNFSCPGPSHSQVASQNEYLEFPRSGGNKRIN